jgi:hypothetical protein
MLLKEIVYVYSENRPKHLNTFCGEKADIFNVEAGCVSLYNYCCSLKLIMEMVKMFLQVIYNIASCFIRKIIHSNACL